MEYQSENVMSAVESLEFSDEDIKVVNQKFINHSAKRQTPPKPSFWKFFLILLGIRVDKQIVLNEFEIENAWRKTLLNHIKNESENQKSSVKKYTRI